MWAESTMPALAVATMFFIVSVIAREGRCAGYRRDEDQR
jgi:hypothetical protein